MTILEISLAVDGAALRLEPIGLQIWPAQAEGAVLRIAYSAPSQRLVARTRGEGARQALRLGRVIDAATGSVPDMEALADDLLSGSFRPETLDGAFLIVVLDSATNRLHVFNDRYGSIPFYQQSAPEAFAASTRLVPLATQQGRPVGMCIEAALSVLFFGHPLNDKTLFEGVRLLPPASHLEIDLRMQGVSIQPYWKTQFGSGRKRSSRAAQEEFHDRMQRAARRSAVDTGKERVLLLTGGYDSRSLLALDHSCGQTPDTTLTWGTTDAIAGTDVDIAKRLANLVGASHRFLRYEAASIEDMSDAWIQSSGLTSDNAGNFVVPENFLSEQVASDSSIIVGDQMIGPSGLPYDHADAVRALIGTTPDNASALLGNLIPKNMRETVDEIVGAELSEAVRFVDADHPKDLQDGLFWSIYVVRWLMSTSYFREPNVSVIRPLLDWEIVEFVQDLPRSMRVDKRMLIETMNARYPKMMSIPPASAASLIDWRNALRGNPVHQKFITSSLMGDALRDSPLATFVDLDGIRAAVQEEMKQGISSPDTSDVIVARLLGLRRFASRNELLGRNLRKAQLAISGLLPNHGRQRLPIHVVAWRLALLDRWYRMMVCGQIEGSA